nr:ORF3 [Torque teno felis virus]
MEMQYGDRCRASIKLKGLFRTPKDRTQNVKPYPNLKPHNLVCRDAAKDLGRSMIYGPKTSTQTESSQKELIDELLQIIQEMSSLHWKRDSNTSSSDSDQSSISIISYESDDESWQMVDEPPMEPPPPERAPDHPPHTGSSLRYCPF